MRQQERSQPTSEPYVQRGFDALVALSDALSAGTCVALSAALPPVWGALQTWPWLWSAIPLATLLFAGGGYEVRVDSSGVTLTLYRAWLRVRRLRYRLDVRVELYEAWESERPEGLELSPAAFVEDEVSSGCFGPHFSLPRLMHAHTELSAAVEARRSGPPAQPLALRQRWLSTHAACLALDGAEYNAQGRIQRVRVSATLITRDVEIPVGSLFVLNEQDGYRDSSRDDVLCRVELGADATLFAGLSARAGAKLTFDRDGSISSAEGAFAERQELAPGLWVQGRARIGFRQREPVVFSLAEPLTLGRIVLPHGTDVLRWEKSIVPSLPPVVCTLHQALALPGYTLQAGDRLYFTHDDRLTHVQSSRPLQVGARIETSARLLETDQEGRLLLKRRRWPWT